MLCFLGVRKDGTWYQRPNLNEVPARHLHGNIQKSVGNTRLELRKENQAGVIDLQVVSIKTVTEVICVRSGEGGKSGVSVPGPQVWAGKEFVRRT